MKEKIYKQETIYNHIIKQGNKIPKLMRQKLIHFYNYLRTMMLSNFALNAS